MFGAAMDYGGVRILRRVANLKLPKDFGRGAHRGLFLPNIPPVVRYNYETHLLERKRP